METIINNLANLTLVQWFILIGVFFVLAFAVRFIFGGEKQDITKQLEPLLLYRTYSSHSEMITTINQTFANLGCTVLYYNDWYTTLYYETTLGSFEFTVTENVILAIKEK